jgi:hypothetical protein
VVGRQVRSFVSLRVAGRHSVKSVWAPTGAQLAHRYQLAPERKTGLEARDVETAALFRDERGWLRLSG